MTPEERITDLEIRLTHLDDTVEHLNQIVVSQQERIDRLERTMRQLKSDQEHQKDGYAPDSLPEPPPPHY